MSYDIFIAKTEAPGGEVLGPLDVKRIVQAVNSFPPFVERGITWSNEGWEKHRPWEGLVIDLEEHQAGAAGQFADEGSGGVADACNLHVSYGTDSDLRACIALAVHIAEATGATAWDLQQDRALDRTDCRVGNRRFEEMKRWLRSMLRSKPS